jgi:hypothetical protein
MQWMLCYAKTIEWDPLLVARAGGAGIEQVHPEVGRSPRDEDSLRSSGRRKEGSFDAAGFAGLGLMLRLKDVVGVPHGSLLASTSPHFLHRFHRSTSQDSRGLCPLTSVMFRQF